VAYDTDQFEIDVIQKSYTIPVLVDFWAEWCGPCKVLGPVLEKLAREHEDEWLLAKLNTEAYPAIATQYAIRSIPNVKLFVDGQVSKEFVGALPEPQVAEWLRKAVPSKYRMQFDGARQLLLEKRTAHAREILDAVIAAEPDNGQAIVLLAQAHLETDPEQAVRMLEPIKLGSEHSEEAEGIRTLVDMFKHVEQAGSLPDHAVRAGYETAIREARSGSFEAALDGFVNVIRRNRYYDDDGSRKACIAIFKLLGEDHQVTRAYQDALSNALY
jgi:putative thioredoxin